MRRRDVLRLAGGGFATFMLSKPVFAQTLAPFDFQRLKEGYRARIAAIRRSGMLPIVDIESSCDPARIDLAAFARSMDRAGLAQMALSVDQPGKLVQSGETWSHRAHDFARDYPAHFIPTGNGGNHPAWTRSPDTFLADTERFIVEHKYPLMGEFEFRHYPSPRQIERGETHRDVSIAIDGPHGHRLFAFAERTGVPFQIHYEIEDSLLVPLEAMLARYPKAKVIWCNLAQVRYAARATRYNAAYLRSLLERHPNLYIDTAFGGPNSVYQPSKERHARVWDASGDVRAEWKDLIADQPYRFLAALDIGGDRMDRVEDWTKGLRQFLDKLPAGPRAIVAYASAWKLLYGEETPI